MKPNTSPDNQPLEAVLRQLQADLLDPTVFYILAGHYYDRDNHP